MFCFIALFILSILGIFSATHRQLAKEALDCVLRRVTFRSCTADFREKIKGKIIAKLIDKSPLLARLFNKHFELLAWIFFFLMLASTAWTIRGGVNYYLYGNCQGQNEEGFCLFDPTGANNKISPIDETCSLEPPTIEDLNLEQVTLKDYPQKDNNSENDLVFVGCYACDYSRAAYPDIKKLVEKEKPNFTFIHFNIDPAGSKLSEYDYCASQIDKNKYWDFNSLLFESDKTKFKDENYLASLSKQVGYNSDKMTACINSDETKSAVFKYAQEALTTNIYGTPTVFVNNVPVVGPKPYRVYKRMLK